MPILEKPSVLLLVPRSLSRSLQAFSMNSSQLTTAFEHWSMTHLLRQSLWILDAVLSHSLTLGKLRQNSAALTQSSPSTASGGNGGTAVHAVKADASNIEMSLRFT